MDPLSPARRNLYGSACLCAGVLVFSLQDAILKGISDDYAITQAMVIRSVVALPLLALFIRFETGLAALKSRRFGGVLLRSALLTLAYMSYYLGFPALPLADAVALFFVAPLLVTLLAGPMLGERVGIKGFIAAFAGFAGVLVIQNPGAGLFQPAALFSVASAFFYAIAMVVTRRLGVTETAAVMAFYQSATLLLGAGLAALVFHLVGVHSASHPSLDFLVRPWAWPSVPHLLLMASCGVIAAVAMSLLTQAYRMANASIVTVFEYTGLLWAPLWGVLFFAEIPAWTTALGAAMITAAGLLAIWTPSLRRGEARPRAVRS
jgi:drug/metabolite transporter (DMT)-like permease